MFDGILKPKFYTKCKSYVNMTKTRLDTIRKKKNAVQKYLKNDVADLLRNGLDYNAYGRAEGLLIERNMLSCYDLTSSFCETISSNLSVMQKQRECPEECKEAVSSLMYAAARFADLPELRDLRNLFTDRYGNSLEAFTNKEFVEKLKAKPPTKEMKLQVLQEMADECSIEWNSKALEQQLYSPLQPEKPRAESLGDAGHDRHKLPTKSKGAVPEEENKLGRRKPNAEKDHTDYDRYKLPTKIKGVSTMREEENQLGRRNLNDRKDYTARKETHRKMTSHGRKDVSDDDLTLNSSSEDDTTTEAPTRDSSDHDVLKSVPEDEADVQKPVSYRFIPPPYLKPKNDKKLSSSEVAKEEVYGDVKKEESNQQFNLVEEEKPKPRSVRSRNLKPPPGRLNISNVGSYGSEDLFSSRSKCQTDPRNEEERRMDGLLMRYSNKQPSHEPNKGDETYLKPPRRLGKDIAEHPRHRHTECEVVVPPARAVSLPTESASATESTKRHTRATSLQPDIIGHVHPNLPDYDELAARIAALRGK